MSTTNRIFAALAFAAPLVSAISPAFASHTHTLKSGETLSRIARRYGVTVGDIVRANGLRTADSLRDGRKLIIPSAPKRTVARVTQWKPTSIQGDRVSVRLGPDTSRRRLTMLDKGAPVTVTARRAGWAQITLPDGRSGWVLESYVRGGKPTFARSTSAPSTVKRVAKAPRPARKRASAKWVAERPKAKKVAARKVAVWKQTRKTWERPHPARRAAKVVNRHTAPRSWAKRHVPEAEAPEAGSDVVRTAYAYRGTPYRYGGSSRGGFDCSGFTSYLYRKQGIALPHSARAQARQGRAVGRGELKAGDLVFFHTVTSGISHVGMYVGNGKFVHASSRRSGGVRVDSLDSGYYRQRFRGARRVK